MPKRLFSTPRYLQKRHELVTPEQRGKNRCEWVLCRSVCHYQLWSLTEIPASRRSSVLQLKMQQWSPFSEYDSYQVWQGGQVQVWIWDKQKQQQLLAETGIKKASLIPETLLRPKATTEVVQLVDSMEGIEGQIWKDGLLVGSRWWPQLPSQTEWEHFQRAHGLPALPQLPSVVEQPLLDRPWGRHTARAGSQWTAVQERFAVLLGIAIFTVFLTWEMVGIFKWKPALTTVRTQIEELTEKMAPILKARNQAMTDKQLIESQLALNPYPSQIELMTQVIEKLPGPEAKLLEWDYQTGVLSFTVEVNQPDPTFYVKTFQALPVFKEVKAKVGSGARANLIVISMEVKLVNDN